MSKLDTQDIKVLNYNENEVFVDSTKEHYKFSASRDGKTPSIISMTLSELQTICSNTDIIITGWLTFDDDVKEEIFKELRITDWENILTNEEIREILTNPTEAGLRKIIDIKNQTYFDRVRIIMFKLTQDGVDITTRVSDIVKRRYEELKLKKRVSDIPITEKDTKLNINDSLKVKELSEQNYNLQTQLNEMKKMMEQLMSLQNTSTNETVVDATEKQEDVSETTTTTVKKAGRPKKTT